MSTEDVAFAMLGNIDNVAERLLRLRQQREISAAMVGVVADARRGRGTPLDRPGWGRPASEEEQRAKALAGTPVVAAPPGTGWRNAPPLEPPPGVAHVDRIAHALATAQPRNPEYRGARAEAALAKAVATSRATPKAAAPVQSATATPEASAPAVAPVAATPPVPQPVAVTVAVPQAGLTRRRLA